MPNFGQKIKPNSEEQLRNARQQNELLQIRYQVKQLDLAAVRVFVLYNLAASIWKNKSTDSSEAMDFALEAFADLQENKSSIPNLYFNDFNSSILALLETHSPSSVPKLREKYGLDKSQSEIDVAYSLLKNKNGAGLAIAKLRRGVRDGEEIDPLTLFFLLRLQEEKHPAFSDVLSEIISVEERNSGTYSIATLFSLIHLYRDAAVSPNLWNRFVIVILRTAQKAAASTQTNTDEAYNLLNTIISDLEIKSPNSSLLAEAYATKNALRIRISQRAKEAEAAYEKIRESEDRLKETISQAEAVKDEGLKEELFDEAARLALDKNEFRLAVELIEKIDFAKDENKLRWHDQFLQNVVTKSLREKDVESASLADSKIIENLSRALSLQKLGIYFYSKKNLISGALSFDEALKLINKNEDGVAKTNALIKFLSDSMIVKADQTADVIPPLIKSINALHTPAAGEKPEGDKYKKYVTSIMQINWNLFSVLQVLGTSNQPAARELAVRIDKKEVKIVADLALWLTEVKTKRDEKETKYESSK